MPKGRESEYFNWPTTDARKTSSKSSMQEGGGILDRFRKNIKDRVKKGKEEFAKEAAKQKAERKSRTIKAEAREGERKATIKAKKEARKKGVEYKKPEGGKDYRKIMKEKLDKGEISLPKQGKIHSPLKGKRKEGDKKLPYSPLKSKTRRGVRKLKDKLKDKKGDKWYPGKYAKKVVTGIKKKLKRKPEKNVTIYDKKTPVQDSPGGVSAAGAKKAETGRKWKSASASAKKAGTSMSSLVAARKKHKKGSAEYKKIQNKINKHYGVKKRH